MEDKIEITIPTDNEGYVLLKCQRCGEYFKLIPSDIDDEEVVDIFCPLCGLTSDSYLTEDVIELAQAKIINAILSDVEDVFQELERKTRKNVLQFKCGRIDKEVENPIKTKIDSLEITNFDCCNRTAKVNQLLKMSGCYCPFCGGIKDGNI